jgi:hypothetical protein
MGRRAKKISKKELKKIRSYIEKKEPNAVGDQMRGVVEKEMPDLLDKLPPKPKFNLSSVGN